MSVRRRMDDSDHAESSQSAMKRKRMAVDDESENEDLSNMDSDNDEEDSNQPTASLVFDHPVAPLPVGDDGYVEGSIVKIVLRNFVTYDYCEFTPGPQLNMIIGPNGTGKSTIVCAVALGLGGSPLLLGRARNIADFVKTGESNASIQIELKKVTGPNAVIQRNINKANNASTWKYNGRPATNKDIMTVITSLNIQVDNLCQFLPQDKVAEFAQLTPPLLLSRTQVAVGDNNLIKWHQSLVTKRKLQKELEKTHESDLGHQKNLQSKNQLLEKDVQRMKEREKLTDEITLLKAKLPLAKYSDLKREYDAAKAEEREALAEKIRIEREAAPVEAALQKCKTDNERDMLNKKKLQEDMKKLQADLDKVTEAISKSTNEAKLKKSAIEGIKKRELKREEYIKKLEHQIAMLEEQVSVEPPTANSELEEEINSINKEIGDLSMESSAETSNAREFMQKKSMKEAQISNKKRELTEMKNINHIRLESLKRYQNDTFKAVVWYRENKSLFRGQVFGPIQLAINLKDKRYAEHVESALGGKDSSHLRTFVFEYAEDYKKFMAELVDKQKLRLTAGWPGNIDVSAVTRTPCTDQTLKERYGLDHFVINLIDGPPMVLAYLCQQAHINNYPVGLRNLNKNQIEKIVEESNFQRFVVENNSYRVKKYSFGRGGSQTTVHPNPPAVVLNDTMDKALYEQKVNELKELEIMAAAIDSEIQLLQKKKAEFSQKIAELKHQRDDKKALRQDVMEKHNKWKGQVRRLDHYREELATKASEPAQLEQEIETLKAQVVQEAKRRGKLALEYKKIVVNYAKMAMRRNKVSLKGLSSHGKHEAMSTFARSQQVLVRTALNTHKQAQQRAVNLKASARRYYEIANQAGENLPDKLKDDFRKICEEWSAHGFDQTYTDIEDEIQGVQAKFDALKMTNPLAVSSYEKLMEEMKKLDLKIAANSKELATLTGEVTKLRRDWEPRLERLVARISEKFAEALQRIGCAGEVGVGKDEDYAKWGIEIRVKFRDHEKLQLLTGQRQSGGERAVSTILYLMSLQSLARAPFRVVDEINQGMDPRNERMIHEQIVKSASMAGTSQYFLITPKLLPDLYYNEHMRVLCIYNGEWQPEKLKPASHYLKQFKETTTAA
ncbi:hypothetical protein [Absidia glauca]|uniref:Structural maintenance of chromosomes protein 5 n=1 Tax=Absidia glauca TaxID=4829 RepID=A0A168QU10_ABSGL|nr:hypothetical protein [Absidia glauca]